MADAFVVRASFAVAAAPGAFDGAGVGTVATFGVAVAGPADLVDGSGPEVVLGSRGECRSVCDRAAHDPEGGQEFDPIGINCRMGRSGLQVGLHRHQQRCHVRTPDGRDRR